MNRCTRIRTCTVLVLLTEYGEERESRAQFRDECLGELAGAWLDEERERRGGWCDLMGALLGLSVRVAGELRASRSVLVLGVLRPSRQSLATSRLSVTCSK